MCAALVVAAVFTVVQSRSQLIDERMFPDEALREVILEFVDTNRDGMLSDEEAAAVEVLDLSSTDVKALDGLGRFANLHELNVSHCGKLASPDFGQTPGLTTLNMLGSGVESMDVATMLDLEALEAQKSCIRELDVTGNANLTYIGVDEGVSVVGADASHLDGRTCLVSCQSQDVRRLNNAMLLSDSGVDEESFEFAYDHQQRKLYVTHQQAGKQSGAQSREGDALFRSTTDAYSWDDAGCVTGFIGNVDSGNPVSVQYQYDSAGHLVACESSALGHVWAYEYDDGGRLVLVKGSLEKDGEFANDVRYSYDDRGRLSLAIMEDLLAGAAFTNTVVSYDNRGLVSSMDNERQTCSFEYDGKGRCVAESLENLLFKYSENVTFEYDAEGRIVHSTRTHQQDESTFVLEASCEYDGDGNEVHRALTLLDETGEIGTASVDFAYAQIFLQSGIAENLLDSRRCLLYDDPTYSIHACSPISADLLSEQPILVRSALYFAGPTAFGRLSTGGGLSVGSSTMAPSATAAPAASYDLANAADRALLNERLSWMSQAFHGEVNRAIDVLDANEQVKFAVHYLGLTNRDTWETGDYTSIAGPGGGANGSTNVRVAIGYVSDVANEFFCVTPDYSALDGMYKYIDGYIYFGVTAPPGQSAGYAAATSVEPLGDGRYVVDFEVYCGSMPYMEQDDAFYGGTPSEMMAALGVSAPLRAGNATVRVVNREGAPSVEFESYELGTIRTEADSTASASVASNGAGEASRRDIITGRFFCLGFDAPNGVTSIAFNDGEVEIVGELMQSDGGGSMGSKTWVFGIDENTKYGYSLYDGFHEQSLEEVEVEWSEARFVGLSIEVEDGVVTMMSAGS